MSPMRGVSPIFVVKRYGVKRLRGVFKILPKKPLISNILSEVFVY